MVGILILHFIQLMVSSHIMLLGINERILHGMIDALSVETETFKSAMIQASLHAFSDMFQNCKPDHGRTWNVDAHAKDKGVPLRLVNLSYFDRFSNS